MQDIELLQSEQIICDLDQLGCIQVSGPDSAKFLQGQLSCDLNAVTPNQSALGVHCDHKGRVLASFRVLQIQNDYLLILAKDLIADILPHLNKYAQFSKVSLSDVSAEYQQILLAGDHVTQDLQAILPELTKNIDQVSQYYNLQIITLPGDLNCYQVIGNSSDLENFKQEFEAHTNYHMVNSQIAKLIMIRAGIAQIELATSGLFTPHALNYHLVGAISFNKGCYTGQEIIARMHYLGKLKQQLYRAELNTDTLPDIGTDLVNEQQKNVGTLVNAAFCGENQIELLAVINNKAIENVITIAGKPITVIT